MSVDNHALQESPLILLGVGRSGTSFTRTLLNSIPCVHLTFEGRMLKEGISIYRDSQFYTADDFFLFLDKLCHSESETIRNLHLIKAVKQSKGYLYDFWQQNRSYAELMREIYWLAFRRPVWGDKLLRAEYARHLLKIWPSAKFLFLFRDPRAVYLSQKLRWNIPLQVSSGYWRSHYIFAHKLKTDYRQQVAFLRFEDLIEKPAEHLERILDFLQVREDAEKLSSSITIDTAVNDKWMKMLSVREIESLESNCYSFMLDLNYDPTIAKEESKFSRFQYISELLRYYGKPMAKRDWGFIKRKNLIGRFFSIIRNSK